MTIKTWVDLVHWIEANARQRTPEDDVRAALWFVACQMAEETLADVTIKDIARIFVNGVEKLTLVDVTDWLREQYEDEDDEQTTRRLEQTLRQHFGRS